MNELIQQFNATGIRYLLIGGQAMRLSGMPRFSMDWDFFFPPRDGENFTRLNGLLEKELDAPLGRSARWAKTSSKRTKPRWGVVQFHLGLPGVPRFDEAERAGVTRKMEQGTPVKCLSGIHLLAAKQAANRPQDQADIEFLKELQRLGKLC